MSIPKGFAAIEPPRYYADVIGGAAGIAADVDLPEATVGLLNAGDTHNFSVQMVGRTASFTIAIPGGTVVPGRFTKVLESGTDADARNLFAAVA